MAGSNPSFSPSVYILRDRCLTTNYVIDETITRLRFAIGWQAAAGFAEALFKSRLFSVLYVDEELEAAAVAVLKRYRDQRLSFTDCATIAAAKARLRVR